jgi:hypothetical protein
MNWCFTTEGKTVVLRARMESDDGMIGDAWREIGPGERFRGVSYAQFKKAKAGTFRDDGATGQIVRE